MATHKRLRLSLVLCLAAVTAFAVAATGNPEQKTRFPVKNWGLMSDRANVGAACAWEKAGKSEVIVAVIDTGIDPTHLDLVDHLWHDPKNPSTYGWNFVTDKPNPVDDHGHGTHVAGIIAGDRNLQTGMAGLCPTAKIMAVKYYSDANPGSVNLRNTVRAIDYAVQHGARIINYSGGGPEFSEDEYIALKKAEAAGILVVAAAGNEHQNSDLIENYYYPSAYRMSNIISVASTDIMDSLVRSSNWGPTKVDVAAPGENIYSTLPSGKYGYMSGTSQATAFVSGIAALIWSAHPELTAAQVKEIILKSVDSAPSLKGRIASGGRVNACSAMKSAEERRCSKVSCFLSR